MKILVTGGNGQLGLSLRKIAGEYPQYEFAFTDMPDADITDRTRMEELAGGCGAIINFAAYTAVDRAESEPENAAAVNFTGAENLAEIAKAHGIPLVHISTDYVFDGTGGTPLTEDIIPKPVSVYGRTKLDGDIAVMFSGCDAAIVRTSWLYSEFGNNFVKTMLRLGLSGQALRVVDDQTGCPTYAADLARAVMQLVRNGVKGCEIYNFCGEGSTTWYGFAREIFGMLGRNVTIAPISTNDYPTAARRPAYSVLSTEKIRAAGITPPRWQDSLRVCLREMNYSLVF